MPFLMDGAEIQDYPSFFRAMERSHQLFEMKGENFRKIYAVGKQ